MSEQTDYAFMKNVIAMLAKLFNLVPPFKLEEFLAPSTAIERKVTFLLNLIKLIKLKDEELKESLQNQRRAVQ